MRCYLCGGRGTHCIDALEDRSGAMRGSWSMARCASCDLIWIDPPLEAAALAAAYHCDYYTHATQPAGGALPAWAEAVLSRRYGYPSRVPAGRGPRAASRFGPLVDTAGARVRYLEAPRAGGRLLDVGCGNGDYLLLMRELGWDTTGVEPDAGAIAAAPAAIRDRLHGGRLEDVAAYIGRFEAITLHHVIEHLADPIAMLRLCASLLTPGGRIVVMTPNTASLGRRVFGRHWLHWDPPRHTFLFTRRSLAGVAQRAGLRVERLRTTARAARWSWQESRRLSRRRRARASSTADAGQQRRVAERHGRARGVDAIAFQMLEHALLPFGDWGEELVLVATAATNG